MRGIEPPLRAWEARVLPLNHTRIALRRLKAILRLTMKTVKKIIEILFPGTQKKAFYAAVRCKDCGEEVRIRINRSSDFQMAHDSSNPSHYFTVKKEVIGKDCFNLMGLTLALTNNASLLFADVKGCEFITFDRERD